jgi:hypothetical protein
MPEKKKEEKTREFFKLPALVREWCKDLLEKLAAAQLAKKLPAFHGTIR